MTEHDRRRARDAVIAEMADRDWNPTDLARAAAIHLDTVTDFLNGSRWPKLRSQARIERALGWPPGALSQIEGGGNPLPPRPMATRTDDRERARAAMPSLTDAEFAVVWAALQGYYAGRRRASGEDHEIGSSENRRVNGH